MPLTRHDDEIGHSGISSSKQSSGGVYCRLMHRSWRTGFLAPAAFVMFAAAADAQSAVTVGEGPHATTTMSAMVSDQTRVHLPAGIAFNVTDVGRAIASDSVSILLDRIVLPTSTAQVRLSVQAAAPSFTPPVAGVTTWDAADVSWNEGQWSNASGAPGALSSSTYSAIVTCHADVSLCGTDRMSFTLAAKPAVSRAGNHTLTIVWKVEAIDP